MNKIKEQKTLIEKLEDQISRRRSQIMENFAKWDLYLMRQAEKKLKKLISELNIAKNKLDKLQRL